MNSGGLIRRGEGSKEMERKEKVNRKHGEKEVMRTSEWGLSKVPRVPDTGGIRRKVNTVARR